MTDLLEWLAREVGGPVGTVVVHIPAGAPPAVVADGRGPFLIPPGISFDVQAAMRPLEGPEGNPQLPVRSVIICLADAGMRLRPTLAFDLALGIGGAL